MVNTVLIDNRVSGRCIEALSALGYAVIRLPSFWGLPAPVSGHPDLLCARLDDGSLLITEEYYLAERSFFDGLGIAITRTEEKLRPVYPRDVLFDALTAGGRVYGKEGCVSRLLLRGCREFVPVRQGYARCSAAMLSEECAVTADHGLASALSARGIEVLTVRPGHILLDGYDTGFIGGAGGRLGKGLYVFFGDLSGHPDGEAIRAFAAEHKINAVSLSDEPLRDYGGIQLL